MCARSPCPRLPSAPRRFCLCSGARRMRVRAERGRRGNARADGASPFSPQVRTREHTISRRTTTVASTQTSGVGGDYRGGHTRVDRHHAPRGCCPMFPKSLPGPSERLDVLSSSRGLGPDTRFLTVSSHAILTYQLRSRSCAPWVWRARRSARATSARSPRGSGARGTTARLAHPSPVTARPAVATPRAPSARRTNRSSGRTTTLP